MSQWFKQRRQEFILATLKTFGQVSRTDLMREFGISLPLASTDIREFLANKPDGVFYDVSAKAYVIAMTPADGAPASTPDASPAHENPSNVEKQA